MFSSLLPKPEPAQQHWKASRLVALGPPGWKSPLLHLPSQQSSWRVGLPEQLSGCRSLCQAGNLGQEAPPGLPKHRKAVPPPLSHL